MKDLISSNDYVISDVSARNDKVVKISSSSSFIKWFFDVKPFGRKIGFYGESQIIEKVKCIYDFLTYYFEVKKKCEKQMDLYNKLISDEENRFVKEAMEQFSFSNSGGKFIRAFLVSLGYNLSGFLDDCWVFLALALEIFQTSILIHDDIIDNADKRRGVETIPLRYQKLYSDSLLDRDEFEKKRGDVSKSMALCIGDAGLYLSSQMIVKHYASNKNLARVLEYYNEIALKTCKGEMIDVILPFYTEYYGETDDLEKNIMEIYKLKTGWYSVVGPLALGCILSGMPSDKVCMIEDAVINLGVSFQIKDDLLGVYGDEKKLGKSVCSDAEEFKQTILYSYASSTKYRDELLSMYGKKISDISSIRSIFDKSGAHDYANKTMDRLFKESMDAILDLDFIDIKFKRILLGFAEYLKVRDK